jgi:hemolysin III
VLSIVIYAVMGWIVLVAVKPLLAALGTAGFAWLATGGVLYTVGIIFFALDNRLRHAHGIWHLFVIAGSLLHFVAIFFYVL